MVFFVLNVKNDRLDATLIIIFVLAEYTGVIFTLTDVEAPVPLTGIFFQFIFFYPCVCVHAYVTLHSFNHLTTTASRLGKTHNLCRLQVTSLVAKNASRDCK